MSLLSRRVTYITPVVSSDSDRGVYETWVAVSDCKHNVGHLAVAQYSSGGKLGVVKERG
jgi:hypothetical protein